MIVRSPDGYKYDGKKSIKNETSLDVPAAIMVSYRVLSTVMLERTIDCIHVVSTMEFHGKCSSDTRRHGSRVSLVRFRVLLLPPTVCARIYCSIAMVALVLL